MIEIIFTYFDNLADDWLFGCDKYQFRQLVEKLYLEILHYECENTVRQTKVIICDRDRINFLAGFLAACAAKSQVFLCNPDWGENEWQQVLDLVQPDIILGKEALPKVESGNISFPILQSSIPNTCPFIMIPTGGSSGKIKFAIHTWETLMASVRGFTEYFPVNKVNSVCVLPLYHVSGLMQFLRSFSTGGKLVILPFNQLELGKIPNINQSDFFISLVPTQLQRLFDNFDFAKYLSKFKTVLLGGAGAWTELLEKAKYYQIKLAPTYGMTETASQVVTMKPDDFLNGKVGCGQVLPHAEVIICDENNNTLTANNIGLIKIKSSSLLLGYYPEINQNINKFSLDSSSILPLEYLLMDDIGYFDQDGYLHVIGRNSEKIITGGENVYPKEIEAAIRATEMVIDVCVIGIPDKYWGQAIIAIYIPKYSNTSIFAIQTILKYKLSKYKIPKHWIPIIELPRNQQGKINHQKLYEIATNPKSNQKVIQ
ncbi:MAG: 2-succinylbenzoate--CoA ligase [Methylacidiphilales bacterium]|nr:2-succinylbenzoate--CoA ligase [Candidatus Methylacidiphilales bacterium]